MVYYVGSRHPSEAGYKVPPPSVPPIPLASIGVKTPMKKLPTITETAEKVERAAEPSIRKTTSIDK